MKILYIVFLLVLSGCHSKLFDATPNKPEIPYKAARYDGARDVWTEWSGSEWYDITLVQLRKDHPELFIGEK